MVGKYVIILCDSGNYLKKKNGMSQHYEYLNSAFEIKEMVMKGKLSVEGLPDEDRAIEHCSVFP